MRRTQERSHIQIATPIAGAEILLRSFTSEEWLGRPFRIEADLLSEKELVLEELLGHNVTIRLTPDLGRDLHMYFNGYVSRLAQVELDEGMWVYKATIVPWIWFLTRMSDCMIFQGISVPEIIEAVFRGRGVSDFENQLSENYEEREYCVQYRETDLDFITRLMEEEGIYYYFKHENGKHTLVLADSPSNHDPVPGRDKILFRSDDEGLSHAGQVITAWSVETHVVPGAVVLNDFDFTNPQAGRLIGKGMIQRGHGVPDFEVYDYPGQYTTPAEGERYSRLRIEALHADYELAHATTNVRELATGWTFTLEGHPCESINAEYLITSLWRRAVDSAFTADGEPLYESRFTGIDADQPFRLPRLTPKRLVYGPQTAIVVGPDRQEIYTDEHGRVKVMFHWDRRATGDQNSSCWVRASQSLAGKGWGSMFLPRVGQEVIVEFLEGDPDRPLITGRVYNGKNPPPYALPDNATVSTTKTSSSPAGGGFNEIRFEDKKNEEQIFIHAEKDHHTRIGNDSVSFIANADHQIVTADRFEKIDGSHHQTIGGDVLVKVTGDRNLSLTGDRLAKLDGADNLAITGDRLVKIDGDDNLTGGANIAIKTGQKLTAEAGTDLHLKSGTSYAVDAGTTVHIKAGATLVIEAGAQLSLKVGGNFIDIGPSGVSISGATVMINSGGAAGSGSGVSLLSPVAPAAPDAPKEPLEADGAEAGEVEEPPGPPPFEPTEYSPSAQVLQEAARDGTPFCEKCEDARQSQSAGAGGGSA